MAKERKQTPAKKKSKAPAKKAAPKKAAAKKKSSTRTAAATVGMKKEYVKSKNSCKVTFRLPRIAAPGAKNVSVVGDFNDWNIYANPMKKLNSGDFTLTLELEPGKEHHFRYLIDEKTWENDWNADKYVKSPFGDSDNSVVVV